MLVAILALLAGIPLTLVGLVGMGPQVNVHRIRPWSIPAWIFRAGGFLLILGLLFSLTSGLDRSLVNVSLIMGTACVVAAAVIVHHEWVQAGHVGQPDFRLHLSPIFLIFWLGTMLCGAVLIVGLTANWITMTLQGLIVAELTLPFALLVGIQNSAERIRANFSLTRSFSLHAYVIGFIVMILGLILLVRSG